MNEMFGEILINSEKKKNIPGDSEFFDNILNLHVERIHAFKFDKLNSYYNQKTQVLCAVIGYISNLNEIIEENSLKKTMDVEIVEELYSARGFNFGDLDGLYTALIWDKKIQKLFVFQDEYGAGLPLYYSANIGTVFFSTNLKKIIVESGNKKNLNEKAVYDFLYTMRLVPNSETLVEDIYKLLPDQYLIVDVAGKKFEIKKKTFSKISTNGQSTIGLVESIEQNISELRRQVHRDDTACALSGGYDTNLILGCLARSSDTKVHAFTVGGKTINEIPSAAKCAGCYRNVDHSGFVVHDDALEQLPDIVWRYDGYICQSGIFLSYELAKAAADNRFETIFLGENADFVLDSTRNRISRKFEKYFVNFVKSSIWGYYFYKYVKKYPNFEQSKRVAKHLKRKRFQKRFDVDFNYILKKSSIMMNSFDLAGVYPFINKKTIKISDQLGKVNEKKKYYKGEVKKILDPNIADILTKIGGSTDIDYLFKGYGHIFEKLLESDLSKRFLDDQTIRKLKSAPLYFMDMLLALLYLFVFNELFLSGKFEKNFDRRCVDVKLSDLL